MMINIAITWGITIMLDITDITMLKNWVSLILNYNGYIMGIYCAYIVITLVDLGFNKKMGWIPLKSQRSLVGWFQVDHVHGRHPLPRGGPLFKVDERTWTHQFFAFWWWLYKTGWWFGCHQFHLPIYWVSIIIPIDELIFFRGVQTTNQKTLVIRSDENLGRDY